MAHNDFQMERHYELWKDHNKQMGRWIFAVVLIACLIPWKVLIPYLKASTHLELQKASLQSANQELTSISNREKMTGILEEQLGAIKAKIRDGTWGQPIEQLKRDFGKLNAAYRFLRNRSPHDLLPRLGEVRGPQGIAPMTPNSLAIVAQTSQLPPVPDELRRLQISPSALMAREASERADEPKFISNAQWQTLLRKQMSALPQQMADKAIRDTVTAVTQHAIEPIRDIVGNRAFADQTEIVENLTTQIETLETQITSWKDKNIGNKEWYRTVRSKRGEIIKITSTIEGFQDDFLSGLVTQKQIIQEQKKKNINARKEINDQIIELTKQQTVLEHDLKTILPE